MKNYLIPTMYTGSKIPMQYALIIKKEDKRTSFYKKNKSRIIDTITLVEAIYKYDAIVKDGKIILRNGKNAYEFKKAIE